MADLCKVCDRTVPTRHIKLLLGTGNEKEFKAEDVVGAICEDCLDGVGGNQFEVGGVVIKNA